MRSKVVAAEMATAAGIPATICNGLRDGALARALAGEAEGTRFAAQEQRHSSFKLWLKYAKPSQRHGAWSTRARRGRCARAGRRCCRSASSRSRASSTQGDAVEIVATTAARIGKGICQLLRRTSCAA